MGCGTCAAACPTGALRVELNTKRGGYEPLLDESCCIRCGRCLEMCPGREVLLDELSGRFLDGDFHQEQLGRYRRLCLGAASDAQIRYHGASGGLVTALLIQALEAKRIDGAIVLGNDYEKPLLTRPMLARTREEIIAANGSKYCPAAVKTRGRPVPQFGRTYSASFRMIRQAKAYHWSFHRHHRWIRFWIYLTCRWVRIPRAWLGKGLGKVKMWTSKSRCSLAWETLLRREKRRT